MNLDDLGDRMKAYEVVETARKLEPSLPAYARVDGRGFSKFTRGMDRPFDQRMTNAMIEVAMFLVKETHACCGYVQSDEISLAWPELKSPSSRIFDGKLQKMTSILAGLATDRMNKVVRGWAPYEDRVMGFDTRVINLPSRSEVTNMFLWRTVDATKNAVSMAARAHFSAKQIHDKSSAEMKAMLWEKGIEFDSYPPAFRNGTLIKREVQTFEATNQYTGQTELVTRARIIPVMLDDPFRLMPHEQRQELVFGVA